MENLQGTKTQANLISAFSGECQARNKYIFFADKAEKDGYEEIANIFKETARNEQAHAKIWYELLQGGELGGTEKNLQDAADGEHFEWTDMYSDFAAEARQEGFENIALLFEQVGRIEQEHEKRFLKLLENVKGGLVFSRDGDMMWICSNCGHIAFGKQAPMQCPVCKKPRAFFKIKNNVQ